MSSSITVGSFYNVKSPLHALDPRVKMAIMVVFMVSVFLAPAPWGLIPVAVMLVLATVLSRVPLRIVGKAIKPLWFFVIFTELVNIFLVREGNVVAHFLGFSITDHALVQSVYMAFRVFALMMAGTIFSLVTSPISITDGAERLLAPLARFGLPVHELAMMYTIAIRFMPTASRGARFDEGRIIDRVRFFVPILVPLFASALRHAEELASAMEARCYVGGEGRTHYHVLEVRKGDWVAIAIAIVYLASLVVLAFV